MTRPAATQPRTVAGGGAKGAGGGGSSANGAGPDGGQAAAKKSLLKNKVFLIAVVLVLIVGGAAYKFLMPTKAEPPKGGDVVQMEPMTLNLTGGNYLKVQTAIQLVAGKGTAADFATSHAAELVIDQFSNRPVASLSTNEARKELTAQLLTALKKAYPGEVYNVFLTQFVTQ